jgi:tRNA nucleotidyltransferase/poly(A) polymerase
MENYNIRKKIRNILKEMFIQEEIGESQKSRLLSILNSLEFKDDVIAAGGDIYAVGGIVRDAVMGTTSDDLDIVVRGVPYDKLFAILSKYGKPTDTSHVDENGKKDFGSTKFVSSNQDFNKFLASNGVARDIDVMLPRKDAKDPNVKGHKGIQSDVNPMYTIQDDLDRRDITINAIAMDLNGNLIANGTGLEDIKNGVIKAVNEDAFIEDPLRMLRAVRFAARYNYNWDPVTVKLIKGNAPMLADKAELPKERFLMEFKKMIGKSDLGRAVKALVDFGMYEPIFGVSPKIGDYSKFDKANSIGEFAYMMFENEPENTIVNLVNSNITNDNSTLSYVKALVDYNKMSAGSPRGIMSKMMPPNIKIGQLAGLYKLSPEAMMNSSYIQGVDKGIIEKFVSGALPKSENEIELKGDEFKNFIIDMITNREGDFNIKRDGVKMGKAKRMVVDAIYNEQVPNTSGAIKKYLIANADKWML